jgi:sulfide:quinone oxidoreductase
MQLRKLTAEMSVSPQVTASDLPAIQTAGFRSIICNRPDGESSDLPTFSEIEAAARTHGIEACYLPIEVGWVDDAAQAQFGELMRTIDKPVLAYCRTGIRATRLWTLLEASTQSPAEIPAAPHDGADDELNEFDYGIGNGSKVPIEVAEASHDIVIVGAGAAGLATASSLLVRDHTLDIAVIDPADTHYYQPGWTMVGAGLCKQVATAREMAAVLHRSAS